MKRQPARLSAGRRHHVHVDVAVVLRGERDPFSVRRKLRKNLIAWRRGQPPRCAARPRREPQIARVSEDDAILGDVGIAQQMRLLHVRRRDTRTQRHAPGRSRPHHRPRQREQKNRRQNNLLHFDVLPGVPASIRRTRQQCSRAAKPAAKSHSIHRFPAPRLVGQASMPESSVSAPERQIARGDRQAMPVLLEPVEALFTREKIVGIHMGVSPSVAAIPINGQS